MENLKRYYPSNAEEIAKLKKEIEFLEEENKRLNDIIDILRETSRTND